VESTTQPSPFLYYFSVSKLAHFDFCNKRCKLEVFNQVAEPKVGMGSVAKGNKMHWLYSYSYKDFDRIRVRYELRNLATLYRGRLGFEKKIEVGNKIVIIVRGMYDDLRILRDTKTNSKYTSLVEVKTTSKKYMWTREVKAAVRQLQLYMWLLKEILEKLNYPLWKRSYVEVYSQKGGSLLRVIPVKYNYDIEDWIRYVVKVFQGLEPASIPPYKFCKLCPVNVKTNCDWYRIRKGYYDK